MRNVSGEYIRTMEGRRDFYAVAEITFQDGTKKVLDKKDFTLSGNSVVQSGESQTFPIGIVVPRIMKICIMNYDDQWSQYDFYGAKIFLRTKFDLDDGTTETINVGNFTVITPESYGTTIEITATDDCYKFDKEYSSNIAFPATMQAAVLDSCEICGVTLRTSEFKNSNYIIQEKPTELTHRQFIGYCAIIAGGNAFFDEYNRLIIKTYDFSEFERAGLDGGFFDNLNKNKYQSGDSADGGSFNPWNVGSVFDGGNFQDLDNIHVLHAFKSGIKIETDDVVITGVKLTAKDKSEYLYGTDGYVLSFENPLAAGQEENTAELIGKLIVGLQFRPFTGDHAAYPLADFMDLAVIVDLKGNTYRTVLTDVDFQYYGFTTLKCSADSPIRNSSKYYGNEVKAIVESRRLVEEEKNEREKAVENLAKELAQSSGLFMTEQRQTDGSFIYYAHDKPLLKDSQIVWKFTADAFGISTDGGKTYPYGLDATGTAVLERIYAIGIDASYINAGYISADQIYGGTLYIGGEDNKNGKLIVRDASGNEIGHWDKDGIYSNVGTIISNGVNTTATIKGGQIWLGNEDVLEAGYIGISRYNHEYSTENERQTGITFSMNAECDYMSWAAKSDIDDDAYRTKFLYAGHLSTFVNEEENSLNAYCNMDFHNYIIKRSYIENLRVKESFFIPNDVDCNIYSAIDMHNFAIKNVKLLTIEGVDGYKTYTGVVTIPTTSGNTKFTIRSGVITGVT